MDCKRSKPPSFVDGWMKEKRKMENVLIRKAIFFRMHSRVGVVRLHSLPCVLWTIADHMPTLHQRSLLRRADVETMLISTIGSRSISERTAGRMASVTKYPSENCDLYHAYTSFLLLARIVMMTTILINCKNWFLCLSTRFLSFLLCQSLYCEQPTDRRFVSTLGEWRNNFYDPKLILKHIIWIHFMMHSFMPPDTCVANASARRSTLPFSMFVLCCCECIWHLIKLHVWATGGVVCLPTSAFDDVGNSWGRRVREDSKNRLQRRKRERKTMSYHIWI